MADKPSSSIVSKCAVILDLLSESGHPMAFGEISAKTGFVKSSCHRILSILQSESLVEYDGDDRKYFIGPRLRKWSRSSWYQSDLQTKASTELAKLSQTTLTNVALSVIDQDELLYLLTWDTLPTRYSARAGDRAPLHCTAAGKVFLAHMPHDAREQFFTSNPLETHTEHTKVSSADLVAEFPDILSHGYAQAIQEEFLQVIGFAAPIFDIQNKIVACVSMWSLLQKTTKDQLLLKTPALLAATRRLSQSIGWDEGNQTA